MAVKKKGVKNANTKTAHVLNLITTADDPTGEAQVAQVAQDTQNNQDTHTQSPQQGGQMFPSPSTNQGFTQAQAPHHPMQNGAYHGSLPNSANINVAMVDDDALGLCIQGALTEQLNAELALNQRTVKAVAQAAAPTTPAPLPPLDPSLLTPDAFDSTSLPEDLFADLSSTEEEAYDMAEEESDLYEDENIALPTTTETTYEEASPPVADLTPPEEEYASESVEEWVEPTPPPPLSPISQAAMESQPDLHYTEPLGQTAPISPIQEAAMGGQPTQLPPLSPYSAPTFEDVPPEQVSQPTPPETLPPLPMSPPSTAPVAELATPDHTAQYSAPSFDQVPMSQVSQPIPEPQVQPVPTPPPVSSLPPDSLFEEVPVEELELPVAPTRSTNQFPPMVGTSPPVTPFQGEQTIPMPQPQPFGTQPEQIPMQPLPMEPQPIPMDAQIPPMGVQTLPLDAQTPPLDTQTLPMEPQTPPIEAQTPPMEPQTPPLDTQTLPMEPQTPPMEPLTPPMEPQTPPMDALTPPLDAQTPPLDAQTPPMDAQTIPNSTEQGYAPSPEEQVLELTPPLSMESLSSDSGENTDLPIATEPEPPILEHAAPPTFSAPMEQGTLPEPPPSFQGDSQESSLFMEDSSGQDVPTSIFLDPILPPDAVNPSSISLEPSAPMELGAIDPVENPMDFQTVNSSPSDTQFELSQTRNDSFTEFDTVFNDDSIDPMNPMLGRRLGEPVEYYNLTEQLVREMAPKFLQTFGTCTCEQCLLDVIAHTLCHLKPKYVVRYQAAFPEIQSEYKKEFASTIVSQLGKSCIAINERPRHLKPFMGN